MSPHLQFRFSGFGPGWKLFFRVLQWIASGVVAALVFFATIDPWLGLGLGPLVLDNLRNLSVTVRHFWHVSLLIVALVTLVVRLSWWHYQRFQEPAAAKEPHITLDITGWLAADPIAARLQAPYIHVVLSLHVLLQSVKPVQLQEWLASHRLDVPLEVVGYYLLHPEQVPKPDLWRGLCLALNLPADFYRTGDAYSDPASCLARCRRYHALNGVVFTLAKNQTNPRRITSLPPAALRVVMLQLERDIAREMRINPENLQ